MSVRTGVIGVGYLGRFHAQKYKDLSNLVGVFDVDAERAGSVSKELSVEAFSTVEDLIKNVDAVSIVVNTKYHFEIAKTVLAEGIHCLLEKPMTETVEQARQLIDLCGSDQIFQIGHIERVNPAFLHIKDIEFKALDLTRMTPFNARGADVDVVLDLMIHDVDLCCQIFGDQPESITASGVKVQSSSHDAAFAELTFSGGRKCRMTVGRCSQNPTRWARGYSSTEFIEADLGAAKVFRTLSGGDQQSEEFERPDALKVEIEHFLASIENDQPVLVTAEQGLRNLEIAQEIVDRIR